MALIEVNRFIHKGGQMNIKYKNNKSSNERKSNQGNMKSHNKDLKEQLKG